MRRLGAIVMIALAAVGCSPDLDALTAGRGEVEADVESQGTAGADGSGSGGSAAIEPREELPFVEPDCGVLGKPCCMPGSACDIGACLRGSCTAFAGAYGLGASCEASCTSRNSFTAGCSCPAGFEAHGPMPVESTCGDSGDDPTAVALCVAPQPGMGIFLGAYLEGATSGECEASCAVANARQGDCSCPAGATVIALEARVASGCGVQDGVLALCVGADDPESAFAGAYQTDGALADGCATRNPLTGGCSCPDGTTEQRIPLGTLPTHICVRG